jgi:hypothetical protein
MILCQEVFLTAPEFRTWQISLSGGFDMGVSLDYTADERGLLIYDSFDRTLHLVNLTRPDLPEVVTRDGVFAVTPCRTPGGPAGYLLTEDWHIVRKRTWEAPPQSEELVCTLPPEEDESSLLLKPFDDLLAVCSITSTGIGVTVVDTHRGVITARLLRKRGEQAVGPWVNVRMVQARLCAEWLDWSDKGRSAQTYRLHDCHVGAEVHVEDFLGDDRWSWPSAPYESYPQERGGVVCCRKRGEVLLLRDSLSRPIERVRVGMFEDEFNVYRCEGHELLSVFGEGTLRIYRDGALSRTLSVAGPSGRFLLLNDGVRGIALCEWVNPSPGDVRLTGVFDYQRGVVCGRASGHVNGAIKWVSPASRYLATVYAKHSRGNFDGEPRYPPGTVIVSDLKGCG